MRFDLPTVDILLLCLLVVYKWMTTCVHGHPCTDIIVTDDLITLITDGRYSCPDERLYQDFGVRQSAVNLH